MAQDRASAVTRRRFLQHTFAASAPCLAAPMIVPRHVLGSSDTASPNDTVRIGFIGVGKRARDLIQILPRVKGAELVAICDCDLRRVDQTRAQLKTDWAGYQHYEKMFEKEKLDGVMVVTKGFQRALPCIHACQSKIDVYAEKPIAHTIREGQALIRAVRKHGRVYQAGTQQRSIAIDQYACELIRSGGIGKVKVVSAQNFLGPNRYRGPFLGEPLPEGLDWDRWCNWTPLHPYSRSQVRSANQYTYGYGHGAMCNLATHGLDMVQFALGMDETGPVRIEPVAEEMPHDKWDRLQRCPMVLRYANGVELRLERDSRTWKNWGGAVFHGEKGNLEIKRNALAANPPELIQDAPPPDVDNIGGSKEGIPHAIVTVPHIQNWVDCIKSREKPRAHVEIAHRSNTVTLLAQIGRELGRPLRWDPVDEIFPDDDEANALLEVTRREGYELPDLS